jgi:hypothetical protein
MTEVSDGSRDPTENAWESRLRLGTIRWIALQYGFCFVVNGVSVVLWMVFSETSSTPFSRMIVAPFEFQQFMSSLYLLASLHAVIFALRRLAPKWLSQLEVGFVGFGDTPDTWSAEQRLDTLFRLPEDRRASYVRLGLLKTLDDRIALLRRRATTVLVVIGLALISTVLIVVFAGRLTSLDAAAISNTDRLSSELDRLEAKLAQLTQVKSLAAIVRSAPGTLTADDAQKMLDFVKSAVGTYSIGSSSKVSVPPDPDTLFAAISSTEKRLDETNKLLQDAWAREINSERGYNDWRNIVATAITRVGVVLIIVFLVQILMGLYRYNTRLSTYYASRKDIINIWSGNLADLPKLGALFAAPKVDFGRDPRHPLEDIIRAVSENMPSIRKKVMSDKPETPLP